MITYCSDGFRPIKHGEHGVDGPLAAAVAFAAKRTGSSAKAAIAGRYGSIAFPVVMRPSSAHRLRGTRPLATTCGSRSISNAIETPSGGRLTVRGPLLRSETAGSGGRGHRQDHGTKREDPHCNGNDGHCNGSGRCTRAGIGEPGQLRTTKALVALLRLTSDRGVPARAGRLLDSRDYPQGPPSKSGLGSSDREVTDDL